MNATATEAKPKKKTSKFKFQLLRGGHTEGSKSKGNYRNYEIGETIETDRDLVKLFGEEKFLNLGTKKYVSEPQKVNLDSLNVQELREVAEDEEIDLVTATTKKEILQVLRNALDVK